MRYLPLALALLSSVAMTTAAAGPSPVEPAAHDIQLGALRLTALRDAMFDAPNDGTVFGVDVGPESVARFLAANAQPADVIHLGVDALLVRGIPGHVVLVDTGLGSKAGGALIGSLARAGVMPAQVTDILVTHAHGDHVGGLVGANGSPAFPRATIRMADAEWAWLKSQADSKALADTIAHQVSTFAPGEKVLPGITAIALRGHTPGHVGYRIESGASSLLDIGDVAHSSVVSLGHPEWAMGFDSDRSAARATREHEVATLAKHRTLIFSPHFPYPGIGRIVRKDSGYAWQPASP